MKHSGGTCRSLRSSCGARVVRSRLGLGHRRLPADVQNIKDESIQNRDLRDGAFTFSKLRQSTKDDLRADSDLTLARLAALEAKAGIPGPAGTASTNGTDGLNGGKGDKGDTGPSSSEPAS